MPTPLHRVRFSWGSDTHIEIEWAKGRGCPLPVAPSAPNLSLAEEESEPDEIARSGVPALCWRDDTPVLFERFQLRENTEYFVDVTLPISMADAVAAQSASGNWPFKDRLARVFRRDPVRRWRANGDDTLTISGQLRLRNHAGIIDLSVRDDASLIAEVVCRKIGYLDEFRELLDAVAKESADLLLQYDSPVSLPFDLSEVSSQTDAALLFQLRYIMADQNLPSALEDIRRRPHSRLTQHKILLEMPNVQEPDVETFLQEIEPSTLLEGGPFKSLFRRYSPREFPTVEMHDSVDTPENRYVKAFVEELRQIAYRLEAVFAETGRQASCREVQEWIGALDDELAQASWRPVGPQLSFPSNSQVLQKRTGYRDILKFDLSLRMSLELPWKRAEKLSEGLIGDIRPVNELYEYWCFFVLRRLAAELSDTELPNDGSLLNMSEGGLQVRLSRGRRSRVGFIYRQNGSKKQTVNLFYNRVFPRPAHSLSAWHGSYTARFDPDYSFEIVVEENGEQKRHWLHFDAKYRLETNELSEYIASAVIGGGDESSSSDSNEYEEELNRVHRRDDLFKMHTYRDGILGSRGAYILFPGNGAAIRLRGHQKNLFIRNPSSFGGSTAYLFPSVGAFDLCPGREIAQAEVLREFLRNIFNALFDGASYQEETGLF